MPYATVVSIDFKDRFSHRVHATTILLAHMNAVVNPYIYIFLNPGFKETYKLAMNNDTNVSVVNTTTRTNIKGTFKDKITDEATAAN
jgi:2-hydroxy-3-keto-5-methylthiopentenyl-1-phosphate phosphatase